MYARLLPKPSASAFLFGPRGTGKSTWLRDNFPGAAVYDLLDAGTALRLAVQPQLLYHELSTLPPGAWTVIDEVQKVPALFDEVQRLIETRQLRFVLSASSTRKLGRAGVNLLAGRAATLAMMPLVSAELGFHRDPALFLRYGSLPLAVDANDPREYLRSYAETYLVQEVHAEALTRNIGAFARFLEVAARHNGQTINASAIAKAVGVRRETVRSHFDVLVDTLLGCRLPAWKLKSASKQVAHSKFYFFDAGIARTLAGRLPYPPTDEELGPLAETFVLSELRAYLAHSRLDYQLHFWRTHDGAEVDLLCETADGVVAIDVKPATRWDKRFQRGLRRLREHLPSATCYGVYFGRRPAQWDEVRVLPVLDFLQRLWNGEVIR